MSESVTFLKRSFSFLALSSLIALLVAATGCGGGSTAPLGASANSAVQVKIGDAPNDSVVAFEITINSVVLTDNHGATFSALSSPTTLELTHLADTNEPLSFLNIPQGTYTQVAIAVSNPEVVYLNSLGQTVEKQLNLSDTITITFNPALVIGPGTSVMNLDLNLAQSLTINVVSGGVAVTPTFVITTSAVPPAGQEDQENEDNGELQDMWGIAGTVSGNTFTMSAGMSPQILTITVDNNTVFENISGIGQIRTGMLLKVNAVTEANGTVLAKKVKVVEMDNASEAEGIVTSETGNPATQISVLDQDGVGVGMTSNLLGKTLNVAISSSTVFRLPEDIDLSNLPFTPVFDATSIQAGQRVEADTNGGMGPAMGAAAATLTASNVELKRQAVHGTVANYGSSGAGQFSFTLNLPSGSYLTLLSKGAITSVTVIQQPTTELRGLSAVTNGADVRVRGVLFWNGAGFNMVAGRIVAAQ
jgi:hypothetical protein